MNNIALLDQLATKAVDGTEESRYTKSGALDLGRAALAILRAELPDIDSQEMGSVLLIFSAIVATSLEENAPVTPKAIGNLAAMMGGYLYSGKEL
jgi:hypothetical protein